MTTSRRDESLIRPAPASVEHRAVTSAARLLLGSPVVLVTTNLRGKHNVMPLAWCDPLSSDPPLIGIAPKISAGRIRHQLPRLVGQQEIPALLEISRGYVVAGFDRRQPQGGNRADAAAGALLGEIG